MHLAESGVDVVVTYRSNKARPTRCVAAVTAAGRTAVALQLDTSVVNSFAGLRRPARRRAPGTLGTDHLRPPGQQRRPRPHRPFAETTEKDFDELVDVHLKGVYFLTQALLPLLADGGAIVNVSTGLTRIVVPGHSAYGALKGAVEVLTRYQAKELGERGIRVNAVAPGATATDFGGGMMRDDEQVRAYLASQVAIGRVGEPDDIAAAVASPALRRQRLGHRAAHRGLRRTEPVSREGSESAMTDLTGKTAVITGSARGLGKAIALRYATLGANLVVNYASSREAADATVAEIESLGATAIAVQADVSNVSDIEHLFTVAVQQFGQVDIAVANAGVEMIGIPFLETTEEQFDQLYGVNAKGNFFTLQAAARHVVDEGRIIYVGSSTTILPVPGYALYASSKLGPRYAVRVLAQELADRGVTVNTILPTAIDGAGVFTDADPNHPVRALIASQPGRIGRRMGTVDDVADAAEYLSSDLARWVSGQSLLVSGGALQ